MEWAARLVMGKAYRKNRMAQQGRAGQGATGGWASRAGQKSRETGRDVLNVGNKKM